MVRAVWKWDKLNKIQNALCCGRPLSRFITKLTGTPSYKFGSVRSSNQYPGTFTYGHC